MYLSLDIGGTFVKYAWMTAAGEIIEQGKFPTITDDLEAFIAEIEKITNGKDYQGIGISSPGVIDSDTGLIRVVTLLPCLSGVNIKEILENRLNVSVSVENDAKCAALAELWKGSVKDADSALIAVLGSGIGTILCDFDDETQKATTFGRRNSGVWLNRDIAKAMNLDHEDGKIIFDYINQHHPIAYPIFEKYCWNLAMVLFNIDYILDLDVISIGGGISSQPILIEKVRECFNSLRERYKEDDHDPQIVRCQFENDANLIGAMYHFFETHHV